jgi:uncharacterized protein YeaO (DUF488 family)
VDRLILCSVRDLPSVEADIKLAITRKKVQAQDVVWVPALAPSEALFRRYLYWRDRMEYDEWFTLYKAWWAGEKKNDPKYRHHIALIRQRISEGKAVAIACFCAEEQYCHRSLVKQDVEKGEV